MISEDPYLCYMIWANQSSMTYVSLNALARVSFRNPNRPVSASIVEGIICQCHFGLGACRLMANLSILSIFFLIKHIFIALKYLKKMSLWHIKCMSNDGLQ